MTIDDMVRAVGVLTDTYDGHTWIDFPIAPGIAVALLEEFPDIDRAEVLAGLERDPQTGWNKEYSDRVRKHFGPRCFVVVDKGGQRHYWNSDWRKLVDKIEDAIRFEDEAQALATSQREQGPLGPEKNPIYEGMTASIMVVKYPEWTACENHV